MKQFIVWGWLRLLLTGALVLFSIASSYADPGLTVTLPASALEGDGELTDGGAVMASEPPASDLIIGLSSNDISEVTVPAAVTIPAGQTSATFDLTVIDDAIADGAQTVTINASAAGWTLGSAVIIVSDNDIGVVRFSADSYAANESRGSVEMTVIRTAGSIGTASVDYATEDGDAIAGVDYTSSSGTLIFEDGEKTKTITISLLDDDLEDGDKLLNVSLSNPGGGAILGSPASADIEILDNENSNVPDLLPPGLVDTVPSDGAFVQEVNQIVITLSDQDGAIDNAAVISSITVVDGISQPVNGTVTEQNDQFSFVPDVLPLPDDTYQVSLTAADVAGNQQDYSFFFTVDSQPPVAPTITGGTVFSGLIQVRPTANSSNHPTVLLTGTREDGTRLRIRNESGWLADSGRLLRVGSGQEYATIQSAVDAADDGDVVLIEPGLYIENVRISKWIHIKGNSEVPDNIIIRSPGTYTAGVPPSFSIAMSQPSPLSSPMIIEGISIEPYAASWNVGLIFYSQISSAPGTLILNRCKFLSTGSNYPVASFGHNYNPQTIVQFQNCYFEKGYSHFHWMESSNWGLFKCEFDSNYFCYQCSNTPVPNDYVTIPEEGYGPDYGTWYILDLSDEIETELGSGDWSINLFLPQGDNALEIFAEDQAGNQSPSVWVDIQVDSIAPSITSLTPADNSLLNIVSESVTISFFEEISGLNLDTSTNVITDANQAEVPGSWGISGNDRLVFTPQDLLADSTYNIDVQLEDQFTNRSQTYQFNFTVDTTAPPAPVVNPVSSPTHKPMQQISGTKEAYAAVWLNDQQVVDHTAETDWSTTVNLSSGLNQFAFKAMDQVGNQSEPTTIEIYFDDISPQPVDTLNANGAGDGKTVQLDWSGYDESLHADIDYYRVYVSSSNFTDLSGLTPHGTTVAGHFTYTVRDLQRDTTYWIAVVAVDLAGQGISTASPISAETSDIQPPEDVNNLIVHSFADRLIFTWGHSADSQGDLSAYRVIFDDDLQGELLPKDQNTYTSSGLTPASGYPFMVIAVDNDGNESSGVSITGVTLLENPSIHNISPRDGGVKLYWDEVEPSEYVKQYRVYVSESDFSSVEGMAPSVSTTSLSTAVTGLDSEVTYYFAVTVVNISDGESKSVETVSASPITGTNVSGEIINDTSWTLAGSPYIVTGDITVRYPSYSYGDNVVTLSIEPGVEVRFEPGTGLYVGKTYYSYPGNTLGYYGSLSVQGTEISPVLFTSNAASPAPGDWKGIYYREHTDDNNNILEHCVIEYGGQSHDANLYLFESGVTVKDSRIRQGSGHGIYFSGSHSTSTDSAITGNAKDGIYLLNSSLSLSGGRVAANGNNGIYLSGSSFTLGGSEISTNAGHGVSSESNSSVDINNNILSGNGQVAITGIHPNWVKSLRDNTIAGNGKNYIQVRGGAITSSGTWVTQGVAYVTTGDITVQTSSYSYGENVVTLSIDPGVEVRFEPGTGLYVGKTYYSYPDNTLGYYGSLSVQGTEISPVLFTSSAVSPAPGDWKGIYYREHTDDNNNILEHCVIEYGGQSHDANLYLFESGVTVKDSRIRQGSGHGIYFSGSHSTLTDSASTGNAKDGIYLLNSSLSLSGGRVAANGNNGIYLSGSSLTLGGSEISTNAGHGVSSESNSSVDINNNILSGNGQVAITGIHPNWVKNLRDNTIAGNGKNYIQVRGGAITSSGTWVTQGVAYVTTGDITVQTSSYSYGENVVTLSIDPGVEVRFEPGTGLYVGKTYYSYPGNTLGYYGSLSVQGTEISPVLFTSSAVSPAPGDWKGIYYREHTDDNNNILEHCVIEYGGQSHDANLYLFESGVTVKDSRIRQGSGHGIYFSGSHSTLTDSASTGNAKDGIYLLNSSLSLSGGRVAANGNNGIYLSGSSFTLGGSEISTNAGHGVSSESNSSVDINNNILSGNGQVAITGIHPNWVKNLRDNTIAGNGKNYIQVRGGAITSSGTWVTQGVAYVTTGDITVQTSSYSYGENVVTLSIDPGVEVRFEPGTGLYVGKTYYSYPGNTLGYYGSLSVQGTEISPVLFTSNAVSPAPGDWKGIYFRDYTNDGLSLLEHCVIEYGGHSNNADVYLDNAKPTIQYNTIRNSSHSGIYLNGNGSNGVSIRCNNLKDNYYGLYLVNNAAPAINNNNFLRNKNYGINNTGSATVDATDNWWNDANGPGYNGDEVNGNVMVSPWLMAESECINTPPTNTAPFVPNNPVPTNGAVRVPVMSEGQPIPVTLAWAGGDPNPWDTVVYDVYFGTAAESLVKEAEGIETASYDQAGLAAGTTYFWQIVARDDTGTETTGPVWHFTTLGDAPDLVISDVVWNPSSDLQAGQTITFTATVENTGNGPVVDAFQVEFYIDGLSIGAKTVNPVISSGASLQISHNWTAATGNHAIEVIGDSKQNVSELYEENNSRSAALSYIKDPTPPDLVGSVPADGAAVKQAGAIVFTLLDQYGVVDDAAVIASVAVLNAGGQPLDGTVSELNDKFTFTPDTVPLADDTYHVSFTAADVEGNTQEFSFTFSVDGQAPGAPAITGESVLSGTIGLRPVQNNSKSTTVTLAGTRENDTSVYVNNQQEVDLGSGDWSASLALAQGDNTLEIWLQDAAGNRGPSVWVDIRVDSVAPKVTSIAPENSSFVKAAPTTVVITYEEVTSGLNFQNCTLAVKKGGQIDVDGQWSVSENSQIIFAPSGILADSLYTVDVQLEDQFTNRSAAAQYHFTLDSAAPPAPVVFPVTTPTHSVSQQISGTKEAYAAIRLDGQQIVDHTAETTWNYTVSLASGLNTFSFAALDRAGNQSAPLTIEILFDDISPQPVDTLNINGVGDGKTIALNWSGYDESLHGDIDYYRVYVSSASFTDLSGLTPQATVEAGIFTYTVQNLERNTTYWCAVVAVDLAGNAHSTANPVSGPTVDNVPPEDITNLTLQSFADRLLFTWGHSADSHGDLAGYRVTFDDDVTGETLPATRNTYEKTGLAPATGYPFKVFAVDNDNNESSGSEITGVTPLANPANLAAEPYSGYVSLTWDAVTPSEYLKHYAVYVNGSDLTTVAGMTPTLTTGATSAKVAGLTNNTPYYFAVTAVNISDGEDKAVLAVSATPVPDTEGPEITDVKVDGIALLSGHTLRKPGTFTCNAQDPAGVSRVEYLIDGQLIRTDYSSEYSAYWNIVPETDGNHTLTIVAYDSLANSTPLEFALIVALDPPPAPIISQPANGKVNNQPIITVSGQAEKDAEVMVYNHGAEAGGWLTVDAAGNFSTSLALVEGENRLRAAAQNRAGVGPLSAEVLLTLDTTLPVAPSNLTALAQTGGVVKLTWQKPSETEASGYNLYRASDPFTTLSSAARINNNLIIGTSFSDLTPQDGTWYYRVSAVDAANNESELSNEASAVSDSIAPRVVSIEYTPHGIFDSESGTMAPGTVQLVMTISEPLQIAPFFSINPVGGMPLSVALTQGTDLTYTGSFVIADTTPSGTAYAVFSGRDAVGNRGTEIDAGASILVDTAGPALSRLVIQPASPIKNDEQDPVTVSATVGLNEQVKSGSVPQLAYLLSGAGRETVTIETLTELAPESGDAATWQAEFILPADAGLAGPETLQFVYQGTDELENISDRITADNLFQVYQGDLPPLDAPKDLSGQSRPGGKIRLTWSAVEQAVGYQLFRRAPDESELTAYERLETVTEFVDEPAADGLYAYAIASIRQENSQEAQSGRSAAVEIASDSTAPETPLSLELELLANGIEARWQAPANTEAVTYSLYRAATAEITSVLGLTPIASGITDTLKVDATPSPSDHCYVVTSVDKAGNESAPSNSYYLNFELLPVASLKVVQKDNEAPLITWTHPGGSIIGYDIYLGREEPKIKLNPELLTDTTFTDFGYSRDERTYTVVALDGADESLGRSITLPLVQASLAENSRIKRGLMNRLEYAVDNGSAGPVDHVRLKVDIAGYSHKSEEISVDASASRKVDVIVGGYDDLTDEETVTSSVEITPAENEIVEIIRTDDLLVGDGMLAVDILNDEFTRGGTGSLRFTLENTGEEDIELVSATGFGTAPSDEIFVNLMDDEGFLLSSTPFKQSADVDCLAGPCVARIPAGATFTSRPVEIPVPFGSPDQVIVELEIAAIHYHLGQPDAVTMQGLVTTREVVLVDTTYYGEVLDVSPQSSIGDEDIIISGRAVERDSALSLPGVPLNLVIYTDGFERNNPVYTDDEGNFSFTFTPLPGESGNYKVWAVHPEIQDRPDQGQFVINRLAVKPNIINLSVPRNYEQSINLQVTAGKGTTVNNLHLVYDELDQVEGVHPQGVTLTLGSPVSVLNSGSSALACRLWADNTAGETGKIVLKVKSDETGGDAWETVVINTHFTEALPVLDAAPHFIETGVVQGDVVTERLVLKNKGLADLYDLKLAVVDAGGNPAPDWVQLGSSAEQGTLAIGESREINLIFAPPTEVAEGDYTYYLEVSGENYPSAKISLHAAVRREGLGNALFKVIDIYTGTPQADGEIIQGVSGVKIVIQNEDVQSIEYSDTTNDLGEVEFYSIPAGRYYCRITSGSHQDYGGHLWIKPGVTTTEEITLLYRAVSVEWSVTETTIEDKYEIVLTATYETNVPAPVIIAEPLSTTLPAMRAGDVYTGEFTLTNYGLIRGVFYGIKLPANNENFTYEFLSGLPDALEAKQRITVPFRVTCIKSIDDSDGSGTGGGSGDGSGTIEFPYHTSCAGGAAVHYIRRRTDGGGGTENISGPFIGSGGFGPSGSGAGSTLSGTLCRPSHSRSQKYDSDTRRHNSEEVGCTVNTFLREFNDDEVDLSLKVPGGQIAVQRWFYGDQWHWDHIRHNLKFKLDPLGRVKSIEKSGVIYEAAFPDYLTLSRMLVLPEAFVFQHGSYTITKLAASGGEGFRWQDKYGNWKEFDISGRMTAYGSPDGILAKLLYEPGESGRLTGIVDRNDNQLLWYEYNTDGLLSAVHDTDNRRVEYSYTNGLLTDIKDVLENHTTYTYDGNGRITAKADAGGRPTQVTYDDYGDVKTVMDRFDVGHFFDYEYDEAKQEQYSRIKTSSGRIKEVWYNRDGEVERVAINGRTIENIRREGRVRIKTDEKGKVTRKEYDEWNNLTKITYPDGSWISIEYEHIFNKPVRMVNQRGIITEFEYDDRGNLIAKIDAVGTDAERVTRVTYNNSGQPLTITVEADADTEAATTKFTYYDNGNIKSFTDPENNVAWFLEYDAAGNLLRYQDPRGYEWKYEYDDLGRLTSRIDPYNNSTAYEYDGANNTTAVINAYLKRFEFEYDDHNNMVKAIDPYNKLLKTDYNTDNLPTVVTDREGKVSERKYDNEGRLSLSIDGAANEIAYVYDETQATTVSSYKPVRIDYPSFARRIYYDDMERVIQETDVLSDTISYSRKYTYDADDNLETVTNEAEKTTRLEYDALNRLKKTILPGNIEIKRKYDDRGNLIELEDPNKGITWYEYDRNNRLTKVIRPMLQETVYEYDPNGNLEVVFDSKGQKIKYEYDLVNRITKVLYYAAGDHTNPAKTVDFTYDKLGNLKTYDDGTTSAEYSYDDLDRKILEIVDYGPFSLSHSYSYFDNGLKKTFTGPDGTTISYSYDDNNRLTGAAIPGQGQATYTYGSEHWNSPAGKLLPGGSSTDYDYDPLMQLKSILTKDPGQNPVLTRSYQHNPIGSITEKATEHGNYTYQYDDLQRLTEAINPLGTDEAYTYDDLDNRKTAAGIEGEWSYNANNQLEGYGNVTFSYDVNGNTTQKAVGISEFNYIYDIEDRLVRVEDEVGDRVAAYYYDPFGRRLWKEVDGERTYFVYSDEGLIGEYDETGAQIRGYGYKPDSLWGTDPLFYKQQDKYYWYQNDHLGAPQKIIDTSGRIVWSAVYDSFGNCQIQTAEVVNNLRLPGQYFDAETGLYYNFNRYYDPNIGRYLRTDPYGEGLNLYAYVFSDPVNWIDPLGLCAVESAVKQIVLGNFTDEVTWLGTFGQIGLGLIGADLLGDIRDLAADGYNWEWSWSHAGQTGMDIVGLFPIVGSLKYADETAALLKASKSGQKLLPSPKLADHHIFPQQFKKFFKSKSIDVDDFTMTLGQKTHLKGVHGKGLGKMPTEKWNAEWKAFMDENPTTKEIYQKAGEMIDRYDLGHVPIHPYKK